MKRKFSILIFLLMAAAVAMAQNYTLTGEVEPVVHVGENFKLRYVVNTTDARNFTLGHVPDALRGKDPVPKSRLLPVKAA